MSDQQQALAHNDTTSVSATAVAAPALTEPIALTIALPRRELTRAALLCAVLPVLFLFSAVFTNRYLSAADLLYSFYPWHTQRPANAGLPANPILSDSVLQFEPWLAYSAERLRQGDLPLWNPENMLGAPFIGNMQSAVFFPLNWPYFIWPDVHMLVVRVWLKLFIAALGAYVLARAVFRISPLGAVIATLTFAFGAFMMVWLFYPLVGVAIWTPWLFWACARFIEKPRPARFALIALLVALLLLAGQPETAYHVALVSAIWTVFLTWQLYSIKTLAWWRTVVLTGSAFVLGVVLASVQLLPFVEYALNSGAWKSRAGEQALGFYLPLNTAWTLVSPSLFGSPVANNWWHTMTNYNESANFNGVLPLLLAPFALRLPPGRQRRLALFLVVMAALMLGVVYHAPLVWDAVLSLPLLRTGDTNRLLLFVELALGLLAGMGADNLVSLARRLDPKWHRIWLWLASITLFLLLAGVALPWAFANNLFAVPASGSPPQLWQAGLLRAAVFIILSAVLIAAVLLTRSFRPRLSKAVVLTLPLLLLADLWLAYSSYIPTIAPANHYPETATTQFLQQQSGLFRTISEGWLLLPNTNLIYNIASLSGYDALQPLLHYELTSRIDPALRQAIPGSVSPFNVVQSRIINFLNVRYVLAPPGVDPNYIVDVRQEGPQEATTDPISATNKPGQTFTAFRNDLTQIQVFGSTNGGKSAGLLVFHLKNSPDDPQDIVTKKLDTANLPDNNFWTINFPMIRDSANHKFYFYFEPIGDASKQAAKLVYTRHDLYADGSHTTNGAAAKGDLIFRAVNILQPDNPWFVQVSGGPDQAWIYENTEALPRAWLTHNVETQPAAQVTLDRLRNPDFDEANTALLLAPLTAAQPVSAPASPDTVTITSYEPENVSISTSSAAPGVLILADQVFPGWQAYVDGAPVTTMTADFALRSVYLPAGQHTVRFSYEPLSFRIGATLSIVALLVVGGLLLWPRLRPTLRRKPRL